MTEARSDATDLETFTRSLAAGKLLLRACVNCGEVHHYPRSYCPSCGSADLDWREASGNGTLYSFTHWHLGDRVITPAMVTLDEGILVLAALVADTGKAAIGAPVTLASGQTRAPQILFQLNESENSQ